MRESENGGVNLVECFLSMRLLTRAVGGLVSEYSIRDFFGSILCGVHVRFKVTALR
jgi:hypothetical protein